MLRRFKEFFSDESGQIFPMFAMILIILIGFAAISIDGGRMYHLKNKAYNIAEASALSAWDILGDDHSEGMVKDIAIEYALANGAIESDVKIKTEYNIINDEGEDINKLTVTITLPYTFSFGKIFGKSDKNIVGVYTTSKKITTEDSIIKDYLPIADADDLRSIGNGETRVWAKGTEWEHVAGVGDNHMGAKFIQVQDIEMKKVNNFFPIGQITNPFTGTFDGKSYIINSLILDRSSDNHVGLFGVTTNATLRNVVLENTMVEGGKNVGILVGLNSSSTISNSHTTGTIEGGRDNVGGLVGLNTSSNIIDSYSTAKVIGVKNVGGLVGTNSLSNIFNSYATGRVESDRYAGGLVGISDNANITHSYATGRIEGDNYIGGLIGSSKTTIISNSYAIGRVDGARYVGGLVGSNETSTISTSYSTGRVRGDKDIGGFVGYQNNESTSINSAWANDINNKLEGFGRRGGIISNVDGYPKIKIDDWILNLKK